MYLRNIQIENYRCLKKIEAEFQPGVNVILGANNSGKTALIDALRLISSLGTGRRDIYASEDDLWHEHDGMKTSDFFEIHATLANMDNAVDTRYAAADALGDIRDPNSIPAIRRLRRLPRSLYPPRYAGSVPVKTQSQRSGLSLAGTDPPARYVCARPPAQTRPPRSTALTQHHTRRKISSIEPRAAAR